MVSSITPAWARRTGRVTRLAWIVVLCAICAGPLRATNHLRLAPSILGLGPAQQQLEVRAGHDEAIVGFNFTLDYDAGLLRVDDVSASVSSYLQAELVDEEQGRIGFSAVASLEGSASREVLPPSEDRVIAVISLRVLAQEDTDTELRFVRDAPLPDPPPDVVRAANALATERGPAIRPPELELRDLDLELSECQIDRPERPDGLVASATPFAIELEWSDRAVNETGHEIQRRAGTGAIFTSLTVTAAGSSAYRDTTVEPLTTYFYRVRAVNANAVNDSCRHSDFIESDAVTTPRRPTAVASELQLNDTVMASLSVEPDVDWFVLGSVMDTRLDLRLDPEVSKQAQVTFDVDLFDATGAPVALPPAKIKKQRLQIKKAMLPGTGSFYLRIARTSSEPGRYELRLKGKLPRPARSVKSKVTVESPEAPELVAFDALPGASLRAKLTSSKGGVDPDFVDLRTPTNASILPLPASDELSVGTKAEKIKDLRLLEVGEHAFSITADFEGMPTAPLTLKIKLVPPKKRSLVDVTLLPVEEVPFEAE